MSKESATKKKELEQIIAAYRSAVDKLATAYTKISAERDTTARIWRMMRLGPRSGNGAWMDREAVAAVSQQIREDVCTEVGRVIGGLRDGTVGPIAQQRSYAAVTRLGPSRLFSERRGGQENLETIVVVPGRSIEDKVQDASATCNAVTRAIKPDELGIRVDRIIKGRNKVVRIMAERNELNKIKPALESVGLEVKHFDKLSPRLLIRDVPADLDKEQFVKGLVKQNASEFPESDVKLVYMFPPKDRKTTSVVVEVPPDLRNRLLERGRVYVGWTSCRIGDHVRITQCYKCLGFGHIARLCKAAHDTCGYCTGAHEIRSCSKRETPKCFNCMSARMSTTDHSAIDAIRCPLLQRKTNEKLRMIRH